MISSAILSKLDTIQEFLKSFSCYPRELLNGYRRETLLPFVDGSKEERAFALLHGMLFTQSQPNLERVREFFEELLGNEKQSAVSSNPLGSMGEFCEWVKPGYEPAEMFHEAWGGLVSKPGYGQKTAALFLRDVHQVHHYPELQEFVFWDDVPVLSEHDYLPIPVDRVILHVFNQHIPRLKARTGKEKRWNFATINDVIRDYSASDHLLWDDLWYWRFITQKIKNKQRVTCDFNEGKYWTWRYAPKDLETRREIKKAAGIFFNEVLNV